MNKNSIDIDILKQFVDQDTLVKMATLEAEKRADKFKYTLNVFNNPKNSKNIYHQLKGTVGYSGKTKLWVSHNLGKVMDSTISDKSAICSQYSALMKAKAKDRILKELLK